MTDHADVIREAMDAQCEYHGTRWSEECRTCEYQQANVAALDTLVAALERGDSLLDQCGREHAAMFARAEAAEAERDEARTKLTRAETELRYTHDRGDHLVYFHEWQEFDKWQRWADDQRKDAEKYQPTAQEFNDAMEGS